MQFLELQKPSDLDFDLELGRNHTGAHIRSRSINIPNQMEIGNFCGWMDGQMDRPEFQLIRSSQPTVTTTVYFESSPSYVHEYFIFHSNVNKSAH